MTLIPGARLGPYEIVARSAPAAWARCTARDTRLDRTVADQGPARRRSRPIRSSARGSSAKRAPSRSSSHPHICTLHDVGEHGGTSFLVMEYLEGETLADRIARGPLPLDAGAADRVQIAGALDTRASRRHRASRPEAGQRHADEGRRQAARLRSRQASSPARRRRHAVDAADDAARRHHGAGHILGTFQYMAPEQIEGHEADARTDIFAFGAVLYEMVTGKRAFEGKSQRDTHRIDHVGAAGDAFGGPPATPSALDRLVRTCLAKDRNDCYQSAHESSCWRCSRSTM